MANPFPGMDPYMEQQWGDAHARIIVYASDQLQDVLPAGLKSRIEERVFVDSSADEGPQCQIVPDLRVVEHVRITPPVVQSHGGVATAEPLLVEIDAEPTTETFIEIIDTRSGNQVVTVIELLSPANKRPGAGQEPYLQKQRECRAAKVNLAEIDLLRGGARQLVVPETLIAPRYRTPYRACVWRACKPRRGEVYAIGLREPLPTIAIPLRASDADVPLNLQSLVEQAHKRGGYDDTDYQAEPVPPLAPDDARWADALLRAAGRR